MAVVLSSSPCYSAITITPPHGKPALISSSPSLPSPSQLFFSMPLRLPDGSRAAPTPTYAVAGFASASTLLRQAREIDESDSPNAAERLGLAAGYELQDASQDSSEAVKEDAVKEKAVKEKAVKEKAVKEKALKEKAVKKKAVKEKGLKGKKPVFKTPGSLLEDHLRPDEKNSVDRELENPPKASAPKEPAPKKLRKKKENKDEGDGQTKIKKAKIIKPGAGRSNDKPKKSSTTTKKAKENVATNSMVPISTQDSDVQARGEFRELCLEKAIPIRRNWTPVRDTVQEITTVTNVEASTASALLPDTPPTKALPIVRFGKLLGGFGFAQPDEGNVTVFEATRPGNGEAVVKRRKIELVNGICAHQPAEKPQRSKSTKKLQTVTAKATAPFMPVESLETTSLLQHFATPSAEPRDPANGQIGKPQTPVTAIGKPPARRTVKAKPATAKSKVKKSTQPILLSPESAMKTAKDQELIFGTSSQLAREDSPSILKDIQQAMKASESVEGDWEPSQAPAKFKPYNSLALGQSRNLWLAAARDFEGSLLDVGIVDLSETPKVQRFMAQLASPPLVSRPIEAQPQEGESERPEADISLDTPRLALEATSTLQQQVSEPGPEPEPELAMPRSVAEAALKKRPKSHFSVKRSLAAKPTPDQMPNYKGFTDIQLTKAVAAYGFKSIKKREARIVLLETCWASKVAIALQEVPVNTNVPQHQPTNPADESPKKGTPAKKRGRRPNASDATIAADSAKINEAPVKKPRGRPRKDSTATTPLPKRKKKASSPAEAQVETAAGDEIYDSSPPTPSPPQRRSPPKSPAQLLLSQTAATAATNDKATTGNGQKLLFESMTKAITSFPPSHDPRNLTFYEKMLMYEPVVLEDLAVWLNAEGLDRVGEDNEVSPLQVKEWCEGRSVCCLWRENLRGGARGRW